MSVLLVQGVNTPSRKQLANALDLQEKIGKEVHTIKKNSEGLPYDLFNAALGFFSHDFGTRAEYNAVLRLTAKICQKLKNGENVTLCL